MDDGWAKVTQTDGVVRIIRVDAGMVVYAKAGDLIEPVVILTVEEHTMLKARIQANEEQSGMNANAARIQHMHRCALEQEREGMVLVPVEEHAALVRDADMWRRMKDFTKLII